MHEQSADFRATGEMSGNGATHRRQASDEDDPANPGGSRRTSKPARMVAIARRKVSAVGHCVHQVVGHVESAQGVDDGAPTIEVVGDGNRACGGPANR